MPSLQVCVCVCVFYPSKKNPVDSETERNAKRKSFSNEPRNVESEVKKGQMSVERLVKEIGIRQKRRCDGVATLFKR